MNCKFCDQYTINNQFCSSSCSISYNNARRVNLTKKSGLCARCRNVTNNSSNSYCQQCINDTNVKYKYQIIQIGDIFNNLLATSIPYNVEKITKNNNIRKEHYVDCKCKCGVIIAHTAVNLIANNVIGCGCESSIKSTTEDFIKRAKLKHRDKYDYSKVKYINNMEWVTVICTKHGEFQARPYEHLRGSDCKRCILQSQSSKQANKWLDSLNIDSLIREFRIPSTRYYADAYDPATNTIYEYNGSFFHGNPEYYSSEDINKLNGKTFGELYQKTIKKQEQLKSLGYNMIIMWGE